MIQLQLAGFDCARTCPDHNERWCRFRPLLDLLGPVLVNSHTAKIKVEYNSAEALRAAVEGMGGEWLGQGKHRLYQGAHEGLGFKLRGWSYPCVIENGQLYYDDFNGSWGNVADLEKLKGSYSFSMVRSAAHALGWMTEMQGTDLVVHHPDGGMIRVDPTAAMSFQGFVGEGCHEARMALGLPVTDVVPTHEADVSRVKLEEKRG